MKKEKVFKVEDYYTPVKNYVLVEYSTNERTDGGVIIPEALREQKMGLPVIAVGTEAKGIEVGQLVIPLPNTNLPIFEMFGKKYVQIGDYQVFAIVSPDYMKASKEWREQQEAEDKANMEIVK